MKRTLFRIIIGFIAAILLAVNHYPVFTVPHMQGGSDTSCEANPITERLLQHVYAIHSPIYPRNGETITYTASARGKETTGVGVASISIEVKQYRIDEGDALPLPLTLVNTFTESEDFPAGPMEAQISLDVGSFPRDTYVKYKAEAVLADGTTLSDSGIRHAANLSDDTVEVFNGAVPVYRRGYHRNKFDFLFIPDEDYGDDEDAYLSDVEEFITEGMFSDPPYRYKRFRRYMNIYINVLEPAYTGDAETLTASPHLLDKPDNFDGEADPLPDLTWVDVAVIAHQTTFQDWASRGFMEGKFCTADSQNVINMESLHALMDLYDEYALSSPRTPEVEGAHPNLFETEEDCEDHVATHPGFAEGHCEPISEDSDNNDPGSNFNYHWCSDYFDSIGITEHVMDNNGSGPFGVEERCQVAWAVDAMLGDPAGSAYGSVWVRGCPGFPCDPVTATATASAAQTIKLPEEDRLPEDCRTISCELDLWKEEVQSKSLVISVRLKNNQAWLRAAAIHQGPPPNLGTAAHYKGRERYAPFRVQLLKGARLIREYGLSDPRLLGAERRGSQSLILADTTWDIRLPWDGVDIDRLRILDRSQRAWLDLSLRLLR
jgi:hypothetical protein